MITTIAKSISFIFDPKFTFLVLLNYIALIKIENKATAILLVSLNTILAIFLIYRDLGVSAKDDYKFADKDVKELRYKTYILIIFVSAVFLPLLYIEKSGVSFEFKFFVSLILVTIAILSLTYFFSFKVSAHITFTGMLISYFITSEIKYAIFLMLAIPLGLSRIKLQKHSKLQVATAIVIVLIYFVVFDLIDNYVL